jgi:hypothetical protein
MFTLLLIVSLVLGLLIAFLGRRGTYDHDRNRKR